MDKPSQAQQHEAMLAQQIAARGVTNPHVLAAIAAVPRHLFVPEQKQGEAYEDHPIPIGCGQTISQPYMVALMTQLLDLEPDDRVLEVGTGSGYQTAILSHLAAEVVSIERHPDLAERARAVLAGAGYRNIEIVTGDGTLGYPPRAPYDAILVTAGAPGVPHALRRQLAMGGCLLCPAGDRSLQRLVKVVRMEQGFEESTGVECLFVPLVGAEGWPENLSP